MQVHEFLALFLNLGRETDVRSLERSGFFYCRTVHSAHAIAHFSRRCDMATAELRPKQ